MRVNSFQVMIPPGTGSCYYEYVPLNRGEPRDSAETEGAVYQPGAGRSIMRRHGILPAAIAAVMSIFTFAAAGCGKSQPVPETTVPVTTEAEKVQETVPEDPAVRGRSPRKPVDMSLVPEVKNEDGTFTVFVYMVGSDLESYGQAASHDIDEMIRAKTGEKVKIVLITGGAEEWGHAAVKSGSTQVFTISEGEITQLADLGLQNMANEGTLESFLTWAGENCVSDRNALILWNHGGGTLMGYGLDENFPNDILELCDIGDALRASGMHFDFVGFDACLMGTVETAKMLSPYADYMIASEETEPSTGWFYTDWLNALGENPEMSTEDLGRRIVDDFMPAEGQGSGYETYTLALVDLSKIQAVCDAMAGMFENERGLMKVDYKSLARARANTKAFGNGMFEQIDLVDFVQRGRPYSANGKRVREAVNEAVIHKYSNVENTHGLAFYFPYANPDSYERVSENLQKVGFGSEWFGFYNDFMNTVVKGQEQTVDSGANTLETKASMGRFADYKWYDTDWAGVEESTILDAGALQLELNEGGYPSLHIEEQQRELLTDMMQWYFVWDKKEMAMTGLGYYRWDTPKTDYYVCSAFPWPTVNGIPVTYFELYNDATYEYGLVPCFRNGTDEFVCLVIEYHGEELLPGAAWDLVGYVHMDAEEISQAEGVRFEMAKKGALPLQKGDTFRFIRYELSAMDSEFNEGEDGSRYKTVGDPQTYDGNWDIRCQELFEASGVEPDKGRVLTWFLLRDIYQNTHKSQMLSWIREKDGTWGYRY